MKDESRAPREEDREKVSAVPSSFILHPSSFLRVGILGAGQLGRMLALAGYPLGLRFRFLDPAPHAPAGAVAECVEGGFDDPIALARFSSGLDVVTYEFENVPVELARRLADNLPVYPPPGALETSQDRLHEKTLFRRLGLPTAPFHAVATREDLDRGIAEVGLPAILKTRRFGYDGKGQYLLRTLDDVPRAWEALAGPAGRAGLLLEGFVRFDRELSQLAVRGPNGLFVCYPLVENHHAEGILRLSLAPASGVTLELQALAEDYARRVLEALDYVGVLAIEFFKEGGRLVANEMAPRVHNSGHWTIEGAETSQFENHLRAVLGWPLGSPAVPAPCAMVNLIGTLPETPAVLAIPGAHLHLYGKAPRPGRKVGHITVRATTAEELNRRLAQVRSVLPPAQARLLPGEKAPSTPRPAAGT
jgi:5-(carboxyamino)imidazole ribonucleotide synthase